MFKSKVEHRLALNVFDAHDHRLLSLVPALVRPSSSDCILAIFKLRCGSALLRHSPIDFQGRALLGRYDLTLQSLSRTIFGMDTFGRYTLLFDHRIKILEILNWFCAHIVNFQIYNLLRTILLCNF